MTKIEFVNVTKTRSIDGRMYNVLDDVSVAVEITSMMVAYLATSLFFTPDHMLKTEALGSAV